MRKFFSFVIAALFSVTMFAEGTATTVYYTAPADVIGDYSLKLNVHMGCADGDDWKQFDMVKTDKTYGEDPIYSVSFTDYWNGLCVMQFQLYDGETWKSQKEAFSGWLAASGYNGKLYVHELGEWLPADAQPGDDAPAPEVTLKGSFDGWGDGKVLEPDDEELTASATIALEAKPYQFKIMVDGAWKGDGQTITREACTDIVFDSNGDDATLQADVAGDYTFVYTYETKKLSVIFPEGEPEPAAKYFITGNAALVGESNKWSPSAIKVVEDSYTFKDLAAGDYQLKVTIDGTWDTEKDFEDLTVVSKGLTTDNDKNINFTLEEVSDVTVTYTGEVFKVEGNFKVEEEPAEVKFYVTGDAALVGELAWSPSAIAVEEDSYTFEDLAEGEYKLKITVDGTWETGKGYSSLTVENDAFTTDEDDNIIFSLEEAGDVVVTYTGEVFKVEGNFKAAEPALKNGFYLIGQKGWGIETLTDELRFAANPDAEGEYQLNVTLVENDPIKVVLVQSEEIVAWFPENEGTEYIVDADHAGAKTIYFRPEGNDDWAAFGGYFFIAANETTGISSSNVDAAAVKFIENGQLFIRINDKVYSILGQ